MINGYVWIHKYIANTKNSVLRSRVIYILRKIRNSIVEVK